MITFDVCKHLATLADATRAYAEATKLSVQFLIAKNECMDKELQVAKKEGKHVTSSTKAKLKRAILDEVPSLEAVMQILYSRFITMHKSVVHINGW